MPETPATPPSRPPGAWLRLLRVHQWSKNLLLLVPPLGAHRFSPGVLGPALIGVAAFSLAASSAYVVNDLLDLEADRAHPAKSRRPLRCCPFRMARPRRSRSPPPRSWPPSRWP